MSVYHDFPGNCRRSDGLVVPGELADALDITKSELSATVGISRDSVYRRSRVASRRTQEHLNLLVRILEKVLPWTSHPRIAYAWYRSQRIPSLGGRTAEELVASGRGEAVERYLSRIGDGGFT